MNTANGDLTVVLSARVSAAVADALQAEAQRQRRRPSDIVRFAVEEYIQRLSARAAAVVESKTTTPINEE